MKQSLCLPTVELESVTNGTSLEVRMSGRITVFGACGVPQPTREVSRPSWGSKTVLLTSMLEYKDIVTCL